ncbi:MAG: hypothetical protein FJ271_04600 [Planctomycetes bacterium]|nr:hypothetical protein [Planctomycetota bacterium]
MAKTNTEIIRELDRSVATLLERVDNLRDELSRVEKQLEESERKRWNLTMSFVGAFLTLLIGLVVALLKR